MTGELVPVTYAREAHNILHGTDLVHHNDLLTAPQAARINRHYDIELHLGTHGTGIPKALSAVLAGTLHDLQRPTATEYDAAAAVIETMQPGDVLFTESRGFPHQHDSSSLLATRQSKVIATPELLERKRAEGSISAWLYAQELAVVKGIQVVYADYDKFDSDAMKALSEGKTHRQLNHEINDKERALSKRMHGDRELKARNTVKDWALEHLPDEGNKPVQERKPKLVLLFGRAHKEGLEEAFHAIGLDTKSFMMKSSSHERAATIDAIARQLAQQLLGRPSPSGHQEENVRTKHEPKV